jgi:hypothetical protein
LPDKESEIIKEFDTKELKNRAKRLKDIEAIKPFPLPLDCGSLLSDTTVSYTYGAFIASITLSIGAFERGLGYLLKIENGQFQCLVEMATVKGFLTEDEKKEAHELRDIRNKYVHYRTARVLKLGKEIHLKEKWLDKKNILEDDNGKTLTQKIALYAIHKSYELMKNSFKKAGYTTDAY